MRLPLVLVPSDLPLAELHAARLDGELYEVDRGFAPVDSPPSRDVRGTALAVRMNVRLIAEQHTAAWVWGAIADPPLHHEFCARIDRRTRPPHGTMFSVREVIINESEVDLVGGMPITTPLRTIIDLVRFVDDFTQHEAHIVARLRDDNHISYETCAADLDARPHLPNKRRALQRLRG